ncbi:hypothetical protein GCM10022221_50620 [Actinocorallia aurea]
MEHVWIMLMGYGHLRKGPSFVWTVPQYLEVHPTPGRRIAGIAPDGVEPGGVEPGRWRASTVHPMNTTQGGRQ